MIIIVELINFDIATYYQETNCADYRIIYQVCDDIKDLAFSFDTMDIQLKSINDSYGFNMSDISMLLRHGIVSIKYTNICIMDTSNIHRIGQVRSHEIKKILE